MCPTQVQGFRPPANLNQFQDRFLLHLEYWWFSKELGERRHAEYSIMYLRKHACAWNYLTDVKANQEGKGGRVSNRA